MVSFVFAYKSVCSRVGCVVCVHVKLGRRGCLAVVMFNACKHKYMHAHRKSKF